MHDNTRIEVRCEGVGQKLVVNYYRTIAGPHYAQSSTTHNAELG